ncbi:hypothetical protein B9Z55_003765 [Caenorhabditis nigoni]|uniref:Uncharacterized protein n=1 Tax=Caenorhabditis nigoni TaxID=1611254 RepID=A0A2G5VSA3_9PELO|nr:hypothetical protein B9Z55_003765 [Caenorhabditis nigoni]
MYISCLDFASLLSWRVDKSFTSTSRPAWIIQHRNDRKAVLTARVACFSETAVSTYGKFLRQQVEERLECWTSGTVRKKKIDVLKKAKEAAVEVKKVIKNRKKASETTKSLVQQEPSIKYQFKHVSSLSIHFFIICTPLSHLYSYC